MALVGAAHGVHISGLAFDGLGRYCTMGLNERG